MSKVYFISGHMDLTPDEFKEHYIPRIDKAIEEGASFVVGDAPGCDIMTQDYIANHPYKPTITVYHMFVPPRRLTNVNPNVKTIGGFTSDEERDKAMTEASHEDIAWVRPGMRKNNGTQRNLDRRIEHNHNIKEMIRSKLPRYDVVRYEDDHCREHFRFYIEEIDKDHSGLIKNVPIPDNIKINYDYALEELNKAQERFDKIRDIIREYVYKQEENPV